jgi:hypothetical protein
MADDAIDLENLKRARDVLQKMRDACPACRDGDSTAPFEEVHGSGIWLHGPRGAAASYTKCLAPELQTEYQELRKKLRL